MEPEQLHRTLSSGRELSTYLVIGNDVGRKQRIIRTLQEHFCESEYREWNIEQLDGIDVDGLTVLDSVSTAPMLGNRRMVIVHHVEKLADPDELIPFVEQPPSFSVLVLVGTQVDKRRRFVNAVKKHGLILELDTPQGDELTRRARLLAEEAGLQLDRRALELLVHRLGEDGGRLDSEIQKLRSYMGEGGRVSEEEIQQLVSASDPALGQYAIFDFVDALSLGRGDEALERLHALLTAGEAPLVVLAMIARQFRLLLAAYAWRGVDASVVAKEIGLRSAFPIRKASEHVRHWTRDAIIEALEACSRCDLAMKAGVDGQRALETLTVTLAWQKKEKTAG